MRTRVTSSALLFTPNAAQQILYEQKFRLGEYNVAKALSTVDTLVPALVIGAARLRDRTGDPPHLARQLLKRGEQGFL